MSVTRKYLFLMILAIGFIVFAIFVASLRDGASQSVLPGILDMKDVSQEGTRRDQPAPRALDSSMPAGQEGVGYDHPLSQGTPHKDDRDWRSPYELRELDDLVIADECLELSQALGISKGSLPAELTKSFNLASEFPDNVHLVRWESAYGLSRGGVVIWMDWNGDVPPSYRIRVQDARSRATLDPQGKAPVELVSEGLSRERAIEKVRLLQYDVAQALGAAQYRRVLLTDSLPSETDSEASTAVEILGDRILFFSKDGLNCQTSSLYSLHCTCTGSSRDP